VALRIVAVAVAVLAAALLQVYALGSVEGSGYFLPSYLAAGLVSAVLAAAVGVALPRVAALGLVGLVLFSAGLVWLVSGSGASAPLVVAVAGIALAGGALATVRRAGWLDLLGGIVLMYVCAAILFEGAAILRAL
jgi:hypothetical protein